MHPPELSKYAHLAEVVPSALASLGVREFSNTLNFPESVGICVMLIDGLGWELLTSHAEDAPVLNSLVREPLRVGFPSTTAAGLGAIGTGLCSGEHGLVGYSFELPDTGVLSALRWCHQHDGTDLREAWPAEKLQPLPTTFSRAAAAGVTTSVVSGAQYSESLLSQTMHRGADYIGVRALGDTVAEIVNALAKAPSFCWSYHADLDMVGHFHGPGSLAWRMQLRQVDRLIESIVENLPADRMLAVIADHGMVAVDDSVIDLDALPELWDGVRAIGGEPRARHVYVEEGATDAVLGTWREFLGERAWVRSRDEAIEEVWFGPTVSDRVRPRIGNVIAAARGSFGMVRKDQEPVESSFVGHHGSLTTAEQLVPLALAFS